MPGAVLAYTILKLATAVTAMLVAGVSLAYAIRAAVPRERRLLVLAGALLLAIAGALFAHDAITRDEVVPFNWVWLLGLDLLAPLWAIFLPRVWRTRDRADHEFALRATTDPLTGVLNRRGLLDQACVALARARRAGDPMTIAILDLDQLKEINDRDGHPAGDTVLHAVAAALVQFAGLPIFGCNRGITPGAAGQAGALRQRTRSGSDGMSGLPNTPSLSPR